MRLDIKRLIDHVRRGRDFVLDLIFPVECLGCGADGEWLCRSCSRVLKSKNSQHCFICGRGNRFGETCPSCLIGHSLDGLLVAGDYNDETLSEAIKSLKYNFVRDLSAPLGEFLSLFLKSKITEKRFLAADYAIDFGDCLFMPVPLFKKRLKTRGFNQSEEIARELAGRLPLEIDIKNLIRKRGGRPQAKLKREERVENIRGYFDWIGENLGGRNIVLIDDVATTGSTLNECSLILKKNGAGVVWGLVLARG